MRERNLAEALQAHTNLKIETVLDPTLLASREVWEKLAQTPRYMPKKNVLVYQVSYLREADRLAAKIAKQIGAKVVSIWAGYGDCPHGKKRVETPEEFVGWFKNAAFVVTTSFHGTAFSLIFEKSFYFMGNGAASENRPKQILDALGLPSRYVSVAEKPTFSEINYADVNRKMGGGYGSFTRTFSCVPCARTCLAENLVAFSRGNVASRFFWRGKSSSGIEVSTGFFCIFTSERSAA